MSSLREYEELLNRVKIEENGAILLGKNIVVDGFAKRPYRVITHVHMDHVLGIEESIFVSRKIIGNPITLELIEALGYVPSQYLTIYRNKKLPLDYNTPYIVDNERIMLIPSDHIPGSAQVFVENDHVRLGYTGDFKLNEKTQVMRDLDVLVIEATYGNPRHRRPFKSLVPDIFVDLVKEGLSNYDKIYIYGYYGKIQEAMMILRSSGINVDFMVPEKIYNMTKILEKYGYRIGNYYKEKDHKANKSEKMIVFKHFCNAKYRKLSGDSLHVVLSGREFNEPLRKIDEYTYLVALSDHADFSELIEYIDISSPAIVVIDGYRSTDPWGLRDHLLKKGVCSVVMPSINPLNDIKRCVS
ncbi:MAG: MBL fold metallo-hydrolase [Desulfurococcaceae archaeon]